MPYIPAPTTGIGVSAQLTVDATAVTLSLAGTTTHQITAQVQDVAGTAAPGTSFVLSAAANASGGTTVYTGTVTGGAANAFAGRTFVVSGFDLTANNGTFECAASTATTLTLNNTAGVADTHSAAAVAEGTSTPKYRSQNPSVATISASGMITAVAVGHTMIEIDYPVFDNAVGTIANTGNPFNGLPVQKIYKEVNVKVTK